MTYPDTQHNESTLGGPPQYPTSQMMPPEYWRKQDSTGPGGTDHGQYITVDYGDHQVHKKPVQPGWDKPVEFVTDLNDDGTEDA